MQDHFLHIGKRQIWGGEEPFGLGREDRRRHLYVVGATGVGKTSLLRSLIAQDMAAGQGLMVVDPHGDLAEELLNFVPPERSDDLICFNATDLEHPVGLNLLNHVGPDQRHLIVSGLLSAFKSVWADAWGARLDHILGHALMALAHCQNVSLLAVPRMLTDDVYRTWVLRQVDDPISLQFWHSEYNAWDARFRNEAIQPVLNKVGKLLVPVMRNIISQVHRSFEPRYAMDHRRIVIANLAKGKLGADNSNLLGAMLITQFQLAAMQRINLPESERVDFTTYVDEFQNFSSEEVFTSILNANRKFAAPFVLAHQNLSQLPPAVRDAVFGNVGNWVAYRVGARDAEELARQYANDFTPAHFTDLGNFEVIVRILQQGRVVCPFFATTIPEPTPRYGRRQKLIALSRERYSTPKGVVEDKINRWLSSYRS